MPKKQPIKITITDDHTLFRKGLGKILGAYPNIELLDESANGQELLDYLQKNKDNKDKMPDVCIVDINMPVLCGYDTVSMLKHKYDNIKVLALSMYDNEENIIKMLRSGANGYVLKDAEPKILVDAIERVQNEGFYHSDLITTEILRNSKADLDKGKQLLTEKELEFLKYCCTEKTYKEIADEMAVSERTVDGYRDRLFTKLKLRSRTGLVIYALRNGLANIY